MYCFLLWLSSDFGGVWLFRMHGGKAAFSACPMYCFLLWLSSDFGGVWLFRMHGGKAAFSACPG